MSDAGQNENGAALAAFLAAGIGSFTLGLIVILSEAGLFPFPAIVPPVGGLSTRTTLAVVVWLVAWALLHAKWRRRLIASSSVFRTTVGLIVLGIALAFPPLWRLLGL